MQKLWGLFFALVLGAILALCLVSPFVGWWMPQNIASYGGEVDNLFNIILAITGVVFVITEALLCWFMFRYAYDPQRKARYVEGNHRLEITWTLATRSSFCGSPSRRSACGSGSSTRG